VKGCGVNGKVLCFAQKRWQGRQCIHPVDYIKNVQHIDRLYIHIHIKHMYIYIYIYIYVCMYRFEMRENDMYKSREAKREGIKKRMKKKKKKKKNQIPPGWTDGWTETRARTRGVYVICGARGNTYVYVRTYVYIALAPK